MDQSLASLLPDFRKLYEAAPGRYLAMTPDFIIVAASDAYLKITGTQRDQIVGRTIFDVFPPHLRDLDGQGVAGFKSSLERVLRDRIPDKMPVQKHSLPQGRSDKPPAYWISVNSPIVGDDGHILYLVHHLEDVTEFTETTGVEKDFKDQLNDKFFAFSLDMLCVSGYDGHFKRVNPAFTTVLGYSADEMCDRSYLDFIHPDDIERTKKEVEKQISRNQQVFDFENRYRRKDGTYRLLSWKSAPVGSYMYAAARDITDSRRIEEELRISKTTAEAAVRELETFSYSVAHDLRSPLRSIMGFSSMLLQDLDGILNDTAKSKLKRVANAAGKMGELIDGLLKLSQVARTEIRNRKLDLSAIAHEIESELRDNKSERNVQFKVDDGLTAEGDPTLVRLALSNLISNAWKYTAKNTGTAKIEFGATEVDGKTAFFVRDNGAGFDMRYASKLFGTFQRLHSSEEFEGTGVGLATVQRIIHRHGGRIWAQAEVEKGATFFFTI